MNIIAHNLTAMNANRNLGITSKAGQKSIEKISSGFKINRASDDAAGLSISEKMRSQIRGLDQGAENIQDGISFVQVADGALNEVHAMLQRMYELSVQSANGTNSQDDRNAIDAEVQELKTEMERVFTTTSFNGKPVWPDDAILKTYKVSGSIDVQGVAITTTTFQYHDPTNDSYDAFAYSGYQILADDSGIKLTWRDYENVEHTTNAIDWETLKNNNYQFHISDYFDQQQSPKLFDANDQPVFDFEISFSVQPEATPADMIKALNETRMSSGTSINQSGQFEDSGNSNTPFSVYAHINYSAAYASAKNSADGYDFNAADDDYFRPNTTSTTGNLISMPSATTVDEAKQSKEGWTFSFYLEGVGNVTGTSNSVSYSSPERSDESKDKFWVYRTDSYGQLYRSGRDVPSSAYEKGTLGSVMDCLTGDLDSATPGLLASAGATDEGGTISIGFTLTADNSFEYGYKSSSNLVPNSSKSVGSFTLSISIDPGDTEETVFNKITSALNDQTILDFYTTDSNITGNYQYTASSTAKEALVSRATYSPSLAYGSSSLAIHGGPSTKDKLMLNYECLRLEGIGLKDTNVLTANCCDRAMNEISDAIDLISQQRSMFGAYQNRLEHSLAINENTAENTTAAESRIRDTDLAEETVNYSITNILQQAAQSVLSQANTSTQGVLKLLS